jgi:dynein regulatory complex protein 1
MRKAYRQELQMIEEVILTDRQVQIETNNKKWEELYKKRDQEEKSDAEQRSEDYWKFVKEMENLNRDFQELYRETNINLENDLDDLQREMERIKTEATMNSEKLDYNYQILKKREDENLIIKSQQKRRINKLQDIINSLRKKNSDYHAQTMQQIEKLSAEVKKLSKNVLDIEKQADHIAAVNNVKFKKIWAMNKARTDKLFKRILDIDKVLYEQQLGLLWNPPEHKIPSKNDMESYRTAISQSQMNNKQSGKQSQLLQQQQSQLQPQPQQLRVPGSSMLETISGVVDSETENENNHFYKRTLNHILNLLADKTGFLIEEELNAILEPYLEYEKTLVKVDNVFAVGISDSLLQISKMAITGSQY